MFESLSLSPGVTTNDIYTLNRLNEEYEKLMRNKEELLKKENRYNIVRRANKTVSDRINFYRNYTRILKTSTLITHIGLAVILLVILVYKLA